VLRLKEIPDEYFKTKHPFIDHKFKVMIIGSKNPEKEGELEELVSLAIKNFGVNLFLNSKIASKRDLEYEKPTPYNQVSSPSKYGPY
jgi:hypothetical protein